MYIRKKKNKSGSYSIVLVAGERIKGKKHPILKVLKSFGSSTDEEELKKMYKEAELYRQKLLAISLPKKSKSLKISYDIDVNSCHSYNIGFYDVYGNYFSKIFDTLPFKAQDLKTLQDLIVMRIANPCSKRKTANISLEYGIKFDVNQIYRLMDKLTENNIKKIKQTIFNRTQLLLSDYKQEVNILFYDLTTIYFETNSQDELRDFGFSKDGKHQHVQIMLAAIVTDEGLPIDYQEFIGNTYEGHTLIPVINNIQQTYNVKNIVLVADAALMNKINLNELDAKGIKYIISARIKNSTKKLRDNILDVSNYSIINSIQDTEKDSEILKSKLIEVDNNSHIIAFHSTKRARKDFYDREKNLEKIQKHLSSTTKSKLTSRLQKSYVKIDNCKIEIDYKKLQLESQYDGFFAFITNIKNPNPINILTSYRGLWQIEQTFRIAKTNLDIRPVYHYTPKRIKAHFIICYMALALIRNVEFILKVSKLHIPVDQIHLLLTQMRKIQITDINNNLFEILENSPPKLFEIYQTLNIPFHKKFQFKS